MFNISDEYVNISFILKASTSNENYDAIWWSERYIACLDGLQWQLKMTSWHPSQLRHQWRCLPATNRAYYSH